MIWLLADFIILFPTRLSRFFGYLFGRTLPCMRIRPKRVPAWVAWLFDAALLFFDIWGVAELFELFMRVFSTHTRPLKPAEVALAKVYFGNKINWNRVRVNEKSWLVPKKRHNLAFVTFNIINSKQPLEPDHFIHEMTHVFQYEKFGAAYISRSLLAQKTTAGYNYGGLTALKSAEQLYQFNLEQQADIMADTYRLHLGRYPRWADLNLQSQQALERLSQQVLG